MNRRFFLGLLAAGAVALASKTRLAETFLEPLAPAGGYSLRVIEGWDLGIRVNGDWNWMPMTMRDDDIVMMEAEMHELNGNWDQWAFRSAGIEGYQAENLGTKTNTQLWQFRVDRGSGVPGASLYELLEKQGVI